MVIERFLAYHIDRLSRRYLTFEKYSSPALPQPKENSRYLLYIHIPFCEERCPYCSFVSVKMEPDLASAYFEALTKEIELYRKAGFRFDSIYVGGGTPTIMPDELARLISFAKSIWPIRRISIETNPNHLTDKNLQMLKDIGTNRLSVGVQSFDDKILESVQRLKKYGCGQEIKERLSSAMGMFDTLNTDMIFNFPNQTEEILARDIEILKEIKADQVTYYPLQVSRAKEEELTRKCGKMDYGQEKRLYKLLTEQLAGTYDQQSVWCFSKNKGMIDEYILDHDEYAGTGPGSWGHINGTMYSNTFSIPQYINRLREDSHAIVAHRSFSNSGKMRHDFLLKLLDGKLDISYMTKKHGRDFWIFLLKELLFLSAVGAITIRQDNIALTPRGRYYWVVMMRTFFSVVGDHRDMRTSLDAAACKSSAYPDS